MEKETASEVTVEELNRKVDALIEISLYNNKLLLYRHGKQYQEKHDEFKNRVLSKLSPPDQPVSK